MMGRPLESVESHKYLGVEIDRKLSWNKHISAITGKANRALGFIRRNLHITVQKKLRNRRTIHSSDHTSNMQTLHKIPPPHTHTEEYKLKQLKGFSTVCEVLLSSGAGNCDKFAQGCGVADTSTEKNGSKTHQFLQSHEQGPIAVRISPSNTTKTVGNKIVPCKESYSAKMKNKTPFPLRLSGTEMHCLKG